MKRSITFIKKRWDIVGYLVFGGLTTIVNYIVYLTMYNVAGANATTSNVVAWAISVVFAFLTNKPFVFKSYDWSFKVCFPEFSKFVSCRVATGIFETFSLLWLVDILSFNGNMWKIIISIVVVMLNYVFSKFVVF